MILGSVSRLHHLCKRNSDFFGNLQSTESVGSSHVAPRGQWFTSGLTGVPSTHFITSHFPLVGFCVVLIHLKTRGASIEAPCHHLIRVKHGCGIVGRAEYISAGLA